MEASSPSKAKNNNFILTTGKRKTSVARTFLVPNGEGKFVINGKTMEDYFGNHPWQKVAVLTPLTVSKLIKADVRVEVYGGGVNGQADAIKHGLARAVAQLDTKMRKLMREHGLLTRDSRIVERKKPGRPKARRRFQFSKR